MAKSKWDDVKEKLTLVEGWARSGLIETQIAKNLGISVQTMNEYKKKHAEFLEAIKKGKEVVDFEVENALYKRAVGYDYEEVTEVWQSGVKIETKVVKKRMAPDTTAQIFWLKNRKPQEWRDKQVVEQEGEKEVVVKLEGDLEKYSV